MGEVYRAQDTRLGRPVAIKILNASLAATPELKARFEREARAISHLNHPSICTLYDVGHQDGTYFLVMEFLEGETLAARLTKGPLALESLLKIGCEIAEALDKAHRAGIIHRDLKPGNVMLTKSGAKLLDFGLAKPAGMGAAAVCGSAPLLSAAMTATSPQHSPLTQQGSIVGTIQYMSPEQLQGMEADARSDIFALGAVLYETATGKRAFHGKSQISVASAILDRDPESISAVQPATPAMLDYCVRTCLAKNPDDRFQTAHDVKLQLKWVAQSGAQTGATPAAAPARARLLPWALATIALIASLGVGIAYWNRPAADANSLQLAFVPPANLSFNDAVADRVVISPDGQKLAFTATSSDGKWQLYVRLLDSGDVQLLPGSDDPLEPFWSPDSKSVAFGSQGKLKRVDLAGGGAQVLCDAARTTGGSWGSKGVIVFGSDYGSMLYQVPASGGEPKLATAPKEGDRTQLGPSFLPDGNHFLFRVGGNVGDRGVWLGALDSPATRQILPDITPAVYAEPGYLLFLRNQALMAQAFDAGSFQLKGDAVPIVAHGTFNVGGGTGYGGYSVSRNGILVRQETWHRDEQLLWFDRQGKQIGAVGELFTAAGQEPHLSPDGKRLVLRRRTDGQPGIWVTDLARGTSIRVSRGGQLPFWTADGKNVIFQGGRQGTTGSLHPGIVRSAANGVGEAELLTEGVKFPFSSSPDGRFILFLLRGEKTRLDIWALPTFGDKKEYPLLNSVYDERDPQLSRDGKWLAYTSDESGTYEVYVQPFTPEGKLGKDKRRISSHSGQQPEWNPNGKELLYLSEDGQMMSVAVTGSGEQAEFGVPKALFKTRMLSRFNISHEYDISPDGQRFLIGTLVGEPKSPPPTVILNWMAGMKK